VPEHVTFIEAPNHLAADNARSRIQVAVLGRFKDPRYGDFAVTAAEVANWSKLLASYFQGRIPIDIDHGTDYGGRSEAAGWITGLSREGNDVYAQVEWTPLGVAAITEKRYLYISPTFTSNLRDQQGNALGPALLRAGLVNNPFLQSMPAVSLSGATLAERVGDPIPASSDSRPVMSDLLKTLAAELSLPEDADEAKVLEAYRAAKAKPAPPKKTDTRTLEAQAAAEGKVLLDAAQVAKLTEDGAKGVKAEADLATMQFENAYTKALSSGRIDAKPETKALHEGIFAVDRDKSIKLLESLPEGVVNLTARGEGGDHSETPTTLDGHEVDPESAKLNQKVKARMLDKGEDYMTALNAIQDESMVI
jgi:phage I-like protein